MVPVTAGGCSARLAAGPSTIPCRHPAKRDGLCGTHWNQRQRRLEQEQRFRLAAAARLERKERARQALVEAQGIAATFKDRFGVHVHVENFGGDLVLLTLSVDGARKLLEAVILP